MSRSVVVLDYGSGNLRSAQRALERVGAEVVVTSDHTAAAAADGLVVPGVGAFAACMSGLRAVDAGALVTRRLAEQRPVLGICVGMQVLFELGVEHGVQTPGLGLLPGRVESLRAPIRPHMGWNTVRAQAGSRLFAGLPESSRFYFVHSYAAPADSALDASTLVHTTDYGAAFIAAVERGPLWATQFHPEKSGDAGATVLSNWLATL